ncbi:MAG: RHS repeat-associated core domain-containing protein, partial [Gordonia polyisoprenivorans]|nr:RHS repeat-associated core domain-containing protein [Gordonia polyisoprenivorans]
STAYAQKFDPYGTPTLTAGGTGNGYTQNPFQFSGGVQDRATGWVKYGARWYNPATGRWTQQDTLDAPLSPSNANRYAYAGGDPINNLDPIGTITACGAVSTIIGLAGGTIGLVAFIGASIVSGGTVAALVFAALGAFATSLAPAEIVFGILALMDNC